MVYICALIVVLIIFIVSMMLLLMIIKPNIYEKELEDVDQVVWLNKWAEKRYKQK